MQLDNLESIKFKCTHYTLDTIIDSMKEAIKEEENRKEKKKKNKDERTSFDERDMSIAVRHGLGIGLAYMQILKDSIELKQKLKQKGMKFKDVQIMYQKKLNEFLKLWQVEPSDHIKHVMISIMYHRDGIQQGGSFAGAIVNNNLYGALTMADKEVLENIKLITLCCTDTRFDEVPLLTYDED